MSRVDTVLRGLRAEGKKALVSFITAGDPEPGVTAPALLALARSGADVLEVGMPFSDPEAEGPSIQASSERALRAGTRFVDVLNAVRDFRREDTTTPIVLMGYLNNVERMGYESFADAIADAGVDGLIMVNLPPEEASSLRSLLLERDIDLIFLSAPTTTPGRLDKICAAASGFVYYVSLKGVTGANHLDPTTITEQVERIRQRTDLPVMVGFGIKTGELAGLVAPLSDGIVVGSALVDVMSEHASNPETIPAALAMKVAEFRVAIDN